MSNPSFINIDQWLFEWKEGNLSPKQIEQLELFLLNNPELDVDKDMWEMAFVTPSPATYPHQHKLLKKKPLTWYYISGAASVLVIASGLYLFNANSIESNSVAEGILERDTNQTLNTQQARNNPSYLSSNQNRITNQQEKNTFYFNSNQSIITTKPNTGTEATANVQNANDYQSNLVAFNNSSTKVNSTADFKNESNELIATSNSRNEHALIESEDSKLTILEFEGRSIDSVELTSVTASTLVQPKKEEEFIEEWTLHRKSASNSKLSFSSKWNNFERMVKRMADNPIALKNLKDPHYHVPGMLANDLNFSSAGTMLATRVQVSSRYQWMGQTNEQLQNQLLIDGYAYPLRAGIGLQVNQSMYHKNGIQNTTVALTYSPKFSLTRNITIEPGFRFKMGTKSIDTTKLTTGQVVEFDRGNPQSFYSANEKPMGKSIWYKDLGVSLMANTKWFYLGLQADNIARHYDNIYGANGNQRAHVQSIITLGTDYESMNHKFGLSPYLVYQKYGALSEVWLGTNTRYNWLTIGAAISSNYEPAASIGLKFDHFSLNYNIDYTKSISNATQSLSHQLTLRFLTNPSRVGQRLLNYM